MKLQFLPFILFFILFSLRFQGQTDTLKTANKSNFDQIFGGRPLYTIGVDTVHVSGKYYIVVKDDCTLRAVNDAGQTVWFMDTSKLGCKYIGYGYFEQELLWRSNRIDFFIQSRNNKLYLIDSVSGKIRRWSQRKLKKMVETYHLRN